MKPFFIPSVVINHHVHVGKRVRIHSGSVLGGDGFGYVMDGGKHHKMPQLGTVIIEDDVEIGANVCIDRATIGATRVGEGTKIDNLVQIAHNCQIGRNCILCGQVGLSGSVIVEDNVVMAGQAGWPITSKSARALFWVPRPASCRMCSRAIS
jgi:UDP-3-O-[3-hydroxymyristoyl] glucosamine N-acyltransferase